MTIPRVQAGWVDQIPHEVFTPPDGDAPLWRYMDLTRFIALLDRRALFFAALRDLPDRFEGVFTPRLVRQIRAQGGQGTLDAYESWRLTTCVNCWNQDTYENVALWSMYASQAGGVAIRTSYNAIRAALPQPPLRPDGIPLNELYIGRVRYIDFDVTDMPMGNTLWAVIHKRIPFALEHEVRLVMPRLAILQAEAAVEAQARGHADWHDVIADIAPPGYDVDVDPAALIQEVVVAPQTPEWLLDLTREVTRRYGPGVRVSRSGLDVDPA